MSTDQARLSIGILLAPRFTLGALGNFVDVLRLAADEGDRSRPILCRWRLVSALAEPVAASCGIALTPDERLGDPRRFDYIAVIGGLIGDDRRLHPQAEAFLRQAAAAKVPLIGICTGAFILARLGLMQDRRICISWFHHQDFLAEFDGLSPAPGQSPGVMAGLTPVSDRIFVVDRDRITCSGGAGAAHLAAFLVDRHLGAAAARKSLSIMIFDEGDARAAAADRPQPGLPLGLSSADPLVGRALHLLQQQIADPPGIERLAQGLGIRRRKLERHFAAALGLSPGEALRRLRLAEVKRLLAQGDLPVTAIAHQTGYCDASHLVRQFRQSEGLPPEAWRQAQRAARMGGGEGA